MREYCETLERLEIAAIAKTAILRNGILYLPAILFAALLGTYLDLYFVGKDLYAFPVRPFPEVFSINILFTLLILPLLTWFFLYLADKMARWKRLIFILLLSALVPFIEKKSVQLGFLSHARSMEPAILFYRLFLFSRVDLEDV